MRTVLAALALALLLVATPAQARLRPVAKLKAKVDAAGVHLSWKDRSRGETRYEVRRSGRRARLKRNRRRFTDRRTAPATRYRYSVRPCRRKRCAKVRRVRVTTLARGARPHPAHRCHGARRRRLRRQPDDRRLPDLPARQRVEHRRLPGAGGHLARLRRLARLDDAVARLRRRRRVRHPVRQRPVHAAARAGELRGGRRVRPRPVPDAARRAGRGRRRSPCAGAAPGRLQALRAVRRRARGLGLARLQRRGLGPAVERAAPEGWTSADAAGLPILPGLARRDEADSGVIRHALRITVPVTQKAYIHPATHWASSEHGRRPAADGPAPAAEGELRHQRPERTGPRDRASRSRPTARWWPTTPARSASTWAARSTRAGTTRR